MDVKKFRFDYHLGQSELAELIGCQQSKVSLMEKGKRSISGIEIKALIEKYGLDTISKYADPSELPATPTVTIDMHKQTFSNNSAPIQNGDGNSMTVSDQLLASLKTKDDQIKTLLDQQDRLITVIEDLSNKIIEKIK